MHFAKILFTVKFCNFFFDLTVKILKSCPDILSNTIVYALETLSINYSALWIRQEKSNFVETFRAI